jgi:hypothetical protein
MSRFNLFLAVVLLCLFSLAVSQPDMPDMPGMGDDDMFEVEGAEIYEEPTFASSKKAAPVVTKKAPLRRVDYTYEGASTCTRTSSPSLRVTL